MNFTKYFEGINLKILRDQLSQTEQYLTRARNSSFYDLIMQRDIWNSNASIVFAESAEKSRYDIEEALNNIMLFSQVLEKAMRVEELQELQKASVDYNAQVSYAEQIESVIKTIPSLIDKMNYNNISKSSSKKNVTGLTSSTSRPKNSKTTKNIKRKPNIKKSKVSGKVADITSGTFKPATAAEKSALQNNAKTAAQATITSGTFKPATAAERSALQNNAKTISTTKPANDIFKSTKESL